MNSLCIICFLHVAYTKEALWLCCFKREVEYAWFSPVLTSPSFLYRCDPGETEAIMQVFAVLHNFDKIEDVNNFMCCFPNDYPLPYEMLCYFTPRLLTFFAGFNWYKSCVQLQVKPDILKYGGYTLSNGNLKSPFKFYLIASYEKNRNFF